MWKPHTMRTEHIETYNSIKKKYQSSRTSRHLFGNDRRNLWTSAKYGLDGKHLWLISIDWQKSNNATTEASEIKKLIVKNTSRLYCCLFRMSKGYLIKNIHHTNDNLDKQRMRIYHMNECSLKAWLGKLLETIKKMENVTWVNNGTFSLNSGRICRRKLSWQINTRQWKEIEDFQALRNAAIKTTF